MADSENEPGFTHSKITGGQKITLASVIGLVILYVTIVIPLQKEKRERDDRLADTTAQAEQQAVWKSQVEGQGETITALKKWKDEIMPTLIDLEDFMGDTTDRMGRDELVIQDNKNKHIEQIQRATVRIGEHSARDVRLAKLESAVANIQDASSAATAAELKEYRATAKRLTVERVELLNRIQKLEAAADIRE